MKKFEYTIKDEVGIHARPAGMLVNTVKPFSSSVSIERNGKVADARRLMAVMGLGVKCGDTVVVTVEGDDEEQASSALQDFFEKSL